MLICAFHNPCVPVVEYLGWAFSGRALAVNVSGGKASRAIFAWRYRLVGRTIVRDSSLRRDPAQGNGGSVRVATAGRPSSSIRNRRS